MKKSIWVPQVVVILMLLWALNPSNPYGYYVLLRVICCAIFAFLAVKAHNLGKDEWVWILGVTAFIYNPIVPVHLTRAIWTVINIVAIFIAVISIFKLRTIPHLSQDKS